MQTARLLVFINRDDVTDDPISLELFMVHFGYLKHPSADDGDPIVVCLHHGLISNHFGQTRHLYKRSSNMLACVEAIVVDSDFPCLVSLLLAFLAWILGRPGGSLDHFRRAIQNGRASPCWGDHGFAFNNSGRSPHPSGRRSIPCASHWYKRS